MPKVLKQIWGVLCAKEGSFQTHSKKKKKIPQISYLKYLCEVCVSVGEHGMDAMDGIFGLARWPLLCFVLQYC